MKILKTYEGFLNKGITIRPMTEADVRTCMDIKFQYFGKFWGDLADPKTKEKHDQYSINKLDYSVSIVAEINGEIVGGYILKKTKLPVIIGNFYDFEGDDSTGIEGVSLFVHPDHKEKGIGHMLKYYYKENPRPDVKFIWGQAFHGLKNIDHWLKSRKLFNDMGGVYFTIEVYDGTIDKYPTTEHLAFYENNKKSAVDYIEELAKEGKSLEEIQGDELLSGFDPEEIKEITQYLNLF
jgi:GNAT superfamily N-acetyltransferase